MFVPLHQDHAIEAVNFRLTGSGEMTEHERPILNEGYERFWKAVLPKVNQAQVMEIAMAPTLLEEEAPKPLAPTQYVEFMRTGKAAWCWRSRGRQSRLDAHSTEAGVARVTRPTSCSLAWGRLLETLILWPRYAVWSLPTKTCLFGVELTRITTRRLRSARTGSLRRQGNRRNGI